jgi:hypothetical protein
MSGDRGAGGRVDTNDFAVRAERGPRGWHVRIVASDGKPALDRPCADEEEARTFASTVQQHIYWLSPERFRAYYRLDGD